jgi:hypothetical protein
MALSLLKYANRAKVAEALTEQGYEVTRMTVNRWAAGSEMPEVAARMIAELFGHDPDTQKSAPAWAEALADETAKKVIAALAPDDLREAAAVLIARLEGLQRLPDDSSPGHGGAASPGELGPPVRGPG